MKNLSWLTKVCNELSFLKTLAGVNLAAALAYRTSFIVQVVGMLLNNIVYLCFWILFFDRFDTVAGYEANDMFLLFSIVAASYGLSTVFAGNTSGKLAYLVAQGRLDYYLVLPRTLISHIIFSRMQLNGLGDLLFGAALYLTVASNMAELATFILVVMLSALFWSAAMVMLGCLAFFFGNAQQVATQGEGSMIISATYPIGIFSGTTKVLLFTVIPAAFVGFVPTQVVADSDWLLLLGLAAAVAFAWLFTVATFSLGLRRYESGSAINTNM